MSVYSGPASEIQFDAPNQLLIATWNPSCAKLNETEIKDEIMTIAKCLQQLSIKNIIVDARHYPFRENQSIQLWINYDYLPKIINAGVKRYAIIVTKELIGLLGNIANDGSEEMQVEYFLDMESARKWALKK